jgi:hypothetical protein
MASPAAVLDSACSVGRMWMPGPMDSAGPIRVGHFALASEAPPTTWIIDSGASHHMYNGPKSAYLTYRYLPHPIDIKLGDDTCVRAIHYGELSIHKHRIEALHTPTFRYSLLSVSEFNDRRFIVTFGNNKCLITDCKQNIVVSGTKNGRLFQVDNDSVAALLNSVVPHELVPPAGQHSDVQEIAPASGRLKKKLSLQDSQLWHRRLAHSNHTAMESIVDGYTYDDRICETCVLAKHERKIIRIPVQRTTTPFELVHSDTCGPFATKSIGGATHFIVFIDDFSRYAYVYPLLNKLAGTCTGIFQLFQKKVENWGYTIKRFRCDNGRGEYDNRLFRGILAAGGISFEPAPPYTQHKNGVAERTIGVLTRKARSLLLDSRAPTEFWAEAICTATYLHARTPNRAVDGKTPYEVLHKHMRLATSVTPPGQSGTQKMAPSPATNVNEPPLATGADKPLATAIDEPPPATAVNELLPATAVDKPPLNHLRRFGCVAYKLIPKQQRMDAKMGARSRKCMMLGYVHSTTKIWKLWDPEQMKVTQCSDVKFDEATNFHTEKRLLANEKDVLGLPEEEPIYTEDRVTLPPGYIPPAPKGHAPVS